MAMPNERILAILNNANNLSNEWLVELNKGVDSKRAHEIVRDSKLVYLIVRALARQYAKNEGLELGEEGA